MFLGPSGLLEAWGTKAQKQHVFQKRVFVWPWYPRQKNHLAKKPLRDPSESRLGQLGVCGASEPRAALRYHPRGTDNFETSPQDIVDTPSVPGRDQKTQYIEFRPHPLGAAAPQTPALFQGLPSPRPP